MIQQQIAIVQLYIHHRKDVEVQISINSISDIAKLNRAYNIANQWLTENNFKQV